MPSWRFSGCGCVTSGPSAADFRNLEKQVMRLNLRIDRLSDRWSEIKAVLVEVYPKLLPGDQK